MMDFYIDFIALDLVQIESNEFRLGKSQRVLVRISSQSFVTSQEGVTNRVGPSEETVYTEVPCHVRYGTIKIPPCSKAVVAEHKP